MKAYLGDNGLDCNPHRIAPDCWYYEEPGGVSIYFNGRLVGILKWRSVAASLRRYEARPKRRPR